MLDAMLKKGIKVRFTENAFEINGKNYDKGTLLVTRSANNSFDGKLGAVMNNLSVNFGIEIISLTTGFVDKGLDFGSPSVKIIKKPSVVLLTGTGVASLAAGEIWNFFEQQLDYPIILINADDFGRMNLNDADVIIMPDGNYRLLNDKTNTNKLKEWINKGGKLIAVEGAAVQMAGGEWGIKMKKKRRIHCFETL